MFFKAKIFPFSRSYHKHEVWSHDQPLISLSLKLIFRMIFTFILLYEANSNNNKNFFIMFTKDFDKMTRNLTKKQPQQSFVKAFQIQGFTIYFNARLFKGFQGLYEH